MVLSIILASIIAVSGPTAFECDSIASELTAQGKYLEAVEMAQKGIAQAEADNDMDTKISCLCTMSNCFVRLGDLQKALESMRYVYEYDQVQGNPEDLSYDLNLLAAICHSAGRDEEAADYIVKSIDYARSGGAQERISLAIRLGNAADIFRSIKRYPEAEKYAQEAYSIDKEDGREEKVPVRLCQLAGCLVANGKIDEAIPAYKESIKGLEKIGNRQSLCIALRELGTIVKSNSEAISYLESAVSISKELGSARDIIEAQLKLSDKLKDINPSKAYTNLYEAHELKDSLFNQEKTREIDRLNVEYKTLEKESMLASAKARNKYAVMASSMLFVIALLLGFFFYYALKSKRQLEQKNREMSENLKTVAESYSALSDSLSKAEAELASVKEDNTPSSNIPLTHREMDIIKLSCKGKISKEIAAELGISVKTVDNIKSTIFHKLGVGTTLELVIFAIRNKLDK